MKKLLSVFIVIILLLLSILPITAFADEIDWIISEDGNILTHGSTVYEKYEISNYIVYCPEGKVYLYETKMQDDEYSYDYIAVNNNYDIVRCQYSEELYVTERGKEILDKFRAGEFAFYQFFPDESNTVVDFSEDDFSMFIKEENKTELDVTTIWSDYVYEVRGFDETGTIAHDCGAVYEINYEYYYIDYDSLDNSYFDAYGAFSYRRGMVPAYKLDEAAVKFVKDAKYSSKARIEEYVYADEEMFLDADDDFSATVTFWILSALFGFVFPAVPLVLSIVFANSKNASRKKHWYFLTGASALWILSALGVILTLIL